MPGLSKMYYAAASTLTSGMVLQEKTKILVIAGPTAVGKSSLAMRLCRELDGEIISADSVQLYRGLDLGSNKPNAEMRAAVPHHLVDVGTGDDPWSAGRWLNAAEEAIHEVAARGKAPIVVGGTMMYTRWLVRGQPDAPAASVAIIEKAENLLKSARANNDWSQGLSILADHSPQRAASLGTNNWYRLSRALEIELSLKESQAKTQDKVQEPAYDARCVFLAPSDRITLFRNIDTRCEHMLENGLVTEVADLFLRGHLPAESSAAKAIGYRQTLDFLEDQALSHTNDLPDKAYLDYLANFATATRNYAAAQIKWYRKDNDFAVIDTTSTDLCAHQVRTAYMQTRSQYDQWLCSPSQQDARDSLIADKKIMRTYSSHPPHILSDATERTRQLDTARLAIEKVRSFLKTSSDADTTLLNDDSRHDSDSGNTTDSSGEEAHEDKRISSRAPASKLNTFRLRALKQREERQSSA